MTRQLKSVLSPDEWVRRVSDELIKLEPVTIVPLDVLDGTEPITLRIRLSVISLTDKLCIGYVNNKLVNIHTSDSEVVAVLEDREESL